MTHGSRFLLSAYHWQLTLQEFICFLYQQGENGQMHGCYNTYCSGFVQTDARIALDMIIEPVSIVRGPQFYVKLAVSQVLLSCLHMHICIDTMT